MATVYWRVGISRFGSMENKVIGGSKGNIEESPVVYPGNKMDAKFAMKQYKKPISKDWRKTL
jgi:hypothetical protein